MQAKSSSLLRTHIRRFAARQPQDGAVLRDCIRRMIRSRWMLSCLIVGIWSVGCGLQSSSRITATTPAIATSSEQRLLPTVTATGIPASSISPPWVSYLDVSAQGRIDVNSVQLADDGRYAIIANSSQVFLYNREAGKGKPINVDSKGQPLGNIVSGATISGDGRTAAFWSTLSASPTEGCSSDSSQPPQQCALLFIYHTGNQSVDKVPVQTQIDGLGSGPGISLAADGRYLVFWANGSPYSGTYLLDRSTNTFSRITPAIVGAIISNDGHWVAFAAGKDIFVWDRKAGTAQQVNLAPDGKPSDGSSGSSAFHEGTIPDLDISADGRYVVFASTATDLVKADFKSCQLYYGKTLPACRHIYVLDRQSGSIELISVSSSGEPGDHESQGGFVSGDGRYVLFTSFAGNLVEKSPCRGYQAPCPQVYLRDRVREWTFLVTGGWGNYQPDNSSFAADITADGKLAAIISSATNLLPHMISKGYQGAFAIDLSALPGLTP